MRGCTLNQSDCKESSEQLQDETLAAADGKSSVNQTHEDDHLNLKPGASTDNVFVTLLL